MNTDELAIAEKNISASYTVDQEIRSYSIWNKSHTFLFQYYKFNNLEYM